MATLSGNLCVIVKFNVLPENTQFKVKLSLFVKNYSYIIHTKSSTYFKQYALPSARKKRLSLRYSTALLPLVERIEQIHGLWLLDVRPLISNSLTSESTRVLEQFFFTLLSESKCTYTYVVAHNIAHKQLKQCRDIWLEVYLLLF